MLFRSGRNWALDFFVHHGWLTRRRPLRRRKSAWHIPTLVPAECLEDRTLLSTITVTTLADNLTVGDGKITLREALQAANTNTSIDGSTSGQSGVQDVIAFQAGLTGTISLNAALGELTISDSVKIQGLGASNTIVDALQNSRIFNITSTAGNVALDGLTLTNGKTTLNNSTGGPDNTGGSGGAITCVSSGTLAISNSVLSGNMTTGTSAYGGAILDDQGPLTITSSTVTGNSTQGSGASGGAIQMGFGSVTIVNSTISNNSTQGGTAQGGAIHTKFGALTVTNSTISGNSTQGAGASGGAINSAFSYITLTNSTLAGNSTTNADGGAIATAFANITAVNSTLVQNIAGGVSSRGGGIILTSAVVTLENSILAKNLDNGGHPDLFFGGGTLVVNHSLIGDNTGTTLVAAPVGSPDANGNLIGTAGSKIDPLLGPLANNGGRNLTMTLLPGSPALNAGLTTLAFDPGPDHLVGTIDDVALTVDGRGAPFVRTYGASVDMGAVEPQLLHLIVNSLADRLDPIPVIDVANMTLRDAVALSNLNPGADTIEISPTIITPIVLTLGQLTITDTVSIGGNGPDVSKIAAGPGSRIFNITSTAGDVTLSGLLLSNGQTTADNDSGGAINSQSTGLLTILGSTVSGNSTGGASAFGGAVYSVGAVSIASSTISGNSTTNTRGKGGAVFSKASVAVSNSSVTGNSTGGDYAYGGAVYSPGPVNVSNSTFSGNSTAGYVGAGGAILSFSDVTLTGSTFSGNSTAGLFGYGGAIFAIGDLTVTNSSLTGNSTSGNYSYGGAAAARGTTIITNSLLAGNKTTGSRAGGGALIGNDVVLTNSTVTGNSTEGSFSDGGAIYAEGDLTATNATIVQNHAVHGTGGGFYDHYSSAAITLRNTIIAQNTDQYGAPDFSTGPANILTVTHSLIGDGSGAGLAGATVTASLIGTSGAPIDPQLAALANNGGPTQTMRLLVTSPAKNAGSNADATDPGPDGIPGNGDDIPLATDQRGGSFFRIVGTVDMGAFEIQDIIPPATPTVDTLLTNSSHPVVTGTWDSTTVGGAVFLQVTLAGTTYTLGTDPQLTSDGTGHWKLTTTATLADGTYDVQVHTADATGNVADDATTNELTIDTVAPATPTVIPLVTNNNEPILHGTWNEGTPAGATLLQVTVFGNTFTLGTDPELTSDGAGNWTLDSAPLLGDGTYDVIVHTADAAGNVANDTTTDELTINTTTPLTPTVQSLVTNNSTPTLKGTWGSTSANLLQVTVNSTTYTLGSSSQLTSIGNKWTLNLTGTTPLPDNTYDVVVHTANAAGNSANDTTTNELTVDTTPPVTPTVNTLGTTSSKPVLIGTWDQGTTGGATSLQVVVAGTVFTLGVNSQLTSNVTGHWTLTTTAAIPEGTYDVIVHTVDAAGNIANDTTVNELTIDSHAPATPTVAALFTTNSTPTLTGTWDHTSLGGAIVLQVTVGGTTYTLNTDPQLTAVGNNWNLNLTGTTPLADGLHEVVVHTADGGGNVANDTTTNELLIDATPPATPTVNPLSVSYTLPILTGTWGQGGVGNATVLQVTVQGTTYTLGDKRLTSDGAGHWTLQTEFAIPDGKYDVFVHTADAAGNNADLTAKNALTVDTTAPAKPTVNSLLTNSNKPTLTGTWDEATASLLQVTINSVTYTLGDTHLTSNGSGHWTLHPSIVIPDGTWNVLVHTADAAGNVANDTTTSELTIDTHAPAAPTVAPLATSNPTPTLTGTWDHTSTGGATVLQVTVNGTTYNPGDGHLSFSGNNWTLNLTGATPLGNGTYNVLVHTVDAAGNVANDTTTNELLVDTAPPTVGAIGPQVANLGEIITLSTTITTDAPNGLTASIHWGDGAITAATISAAGGLHLSGQHAYSSVGLFNVQVVVHNAVGVGPTVNTTYNVAHYGNLTVAAGKTVTLTSAADPSLTYDFTVQMSAAGITLIGAHGTTFNGAATLGINGATGLTATLGNGTNRVRVNGNGGAVNLTLGAGQNDVTVQNFTGGAMTLATTGSLSLHALASTLASLKVTGGAAGSDLFQGFGLHVTGATSLALGGGTNTVQIADSHFNGFAYTSTGPADNIQVETGIGNGSGTQFDGAVSLTLAGNAQIFVSPTLASDQTTFKGSVTIKAATPNALLTKSTQAIFVKVPKLTNVTIV